MVPIFKTFFYIAGRVKIYTGVKVIKEQVCQTPVSLELLFVVQDEIGRT